MTGSEEDDESLQVIVAHTGQPTQGDQVRERDGRGLPNPDDDAQHAQASVHTVPTLGKGTVDSSTVRGEGKR